MLESHWSHVHITLTVKHFIFHAFLQNVLVIARFDLLFKSLNVTKTVNISLAHLRFFKKLQMFLMLLGFIHAAPPLPKSPLIPAAKTFGLKLAQPTSQNDFNLFLLLAGGGCILSISPCWTLPTYPHRVVKGPHFEA